MEWKPIETAPKDGTMIQLRQDNLAPCHAWWDGHRWRWVEFQFPARPTHWMPLPRRPLVSEKEKERGKT